MLKLLIRKFLHRGIRAILWARSRPLCWEQQEGTTVIVAPHPDDEALGCGGLICLRTHRHLPTQVIYLTDGSASHPGHPLLSPVDLAKRRTHEARIAMESVGVSSDCLHFLGAPDGQLPTLSLKDAGDLVHRIAQLLDSLQAAQIYVPCRADASTEHTAAFALIEEARKNCIHPTVLREYPIWSWWSPPRLIRPALTARCIHRLELGPVAPAKAKLLRQYLTQTEAVPPWEIPVLSAHFLGFFESGVEYYLEQ